MRGPLEILNAHFDGERLSDDEARALSSWVNQHPDNARAVVELGMIHEMTDSILSVPRLLDQLSLADDPAVKRSIGASLDWIEARPVATPGAGRRDNSRVLAASGLMLAASVLLAVTVLWASAVRTNGPVVAESTPAPAAPAEPAAVEEAEVIVATVFDAFGVRWDDRRPAARGLHVRRGAKISVEAGVLALTTSSSCDVIVEGPAVLRFEGEDHLHVEQGRVTARIGEGVARLVVDTPSAQVVDLGTEFGVSVGPEGQTSVAVYEGKVELIGKDPSGLTSEVNRRKLNAGRSGYVSQDGELRWTIETLPHEREFIRPDEIAALRDARRGSDLADAQVRFYELQRIQGLIGYQGFDIPSGAAEHRLSFANPPLRSDAEARFDRDIAAGSMHSSGALVVEPGSRVFLALDTASDSPLGRAGVLTERGMVGRSGTELWLAWRSRSVDPNHPGTYAGLSFMFGDERQFHEPLFLGIGDSSDDLILAANIGSHSLRHTLSDGQTMTAGDQPHLWVLRMVFGERADKASVWCDVTPAEALQTRPHAEIVNANLMFDRVRLAVSSNGGAWIFDDLMLAESPEAIGAALGLLGDD